MHGPLICHECRIFLKEDEEHEKEQQAYEDRRQAKYAAQLAGDHNKTETDNKDSTQGGGTTQQRGYLRRCAITITSTRTTSKLHPRYPRAGLHPWPTGYKGG
jgi:hypothetical protein